MHKLSEHAYIREFMMSIERKKNRDTQRPGFLGDKNKSLTKEIAFFKNYCFLLWYFLMKFLWQNSSLTATVPKDCQLLSNEIQINIIFSFFSDVVGFFSPNQLIETMFSSRGYSSDISSSYFIGLSKVWIMLHQGSVGRVQNEMKNALLHFQVFFWQFLLLFSL